MTGFQMLIDKESELLIEASFDGQKTWHELKRKKVRVGLLPAASPLPALLGGAASNA
jgi:hypothetical protein